MADKNEVIATEPVVTAPVVTDAATEPAVEAAPVVVLRPEIAAKEPRDVKIGLRFTENEVAFEVVGTGDNGVFNVRNGETGEVLPVSHTELCNRVGDNLAFI